MKFLTKHFLKHSLTVDPFQALQTCSISRFRNVVANVFITHTDLSVGVLLVLVRGPMIRLRSVRVNGQQNSLYFTVLGDTYPKRQFAKSTF